MYAPPELAELIQSGMFVPVMPARGGRGFPQYMPMPPMQFMPHPMARPHGGYGVDGPPQMRKLFIGGLSHETTDDQLRVYFSQWGPVVDAIVIRDPHTKQSRGFGFVTFATVYSAETAIAERPHVIGGKTVDSKRAIPREQMTSMLPPSFFDIDPVPGTKLLLSGLHYEHHSVDCIRIYFETFGPLDQVEILGQPRGLGFIIFEDKESADKCLQHNRGRHIINEKKVDVRMWPKPQPQQPNSATYWRRPQPLYEQMAGLSVSSRNAAATIDHAQHRAEVDEDSYGGTTTEDDCNASSDHACSESASDTESPASGSHTSMP